MLDTDRILSREQIAQTAAALRLQGKKIVFLSGDEEYRSEEACPMLAKILSERHGFDSTVLFVCWPRSIAAR